MQELINMLIDECKKTIRDRSERGVLDPKALDDLTFTVSRISEMIDESNSVEQSKGITIEFDSKKLSERTIEEVCEIVDERIEEYIDENIDLIDRKLGKVTERKSRD